MAWKSLRWFLLAACVAVQVGCAADERRAAAGPDDSSPDLEPVPSHDDSHGWGTNITTGGH